MTKNERLRKPAEFRRVYAGGERIKGRFVTAFFMPSETSFQRVGITASKKAVGNAVRRNRSKRLLREAFRLSKEDLAALRKKYDWVLNARNELPEVKADKVIDDLRRIIAKVVELERRNSRGGKNVDG